MVDFEAAPIRLVESQGGAGWRWWMPWRWIALLGVVSSVWGSGAQGQRQGQAGAPATTDGKENEISTLGTDTAIKVHVNLVLVRVVVRDAGGKVVLGLKQEDFQVLDNGKQQRISTFSVETAETSGNSGAATTEGKAPPRLLRLSLFPFPRRL
jgi:hypothetical protein